MIWEVHWGFLYQSKHISSFWSKYLKYPIQPKIPFLMNNNWVGKKKTRNNRDFTSILLCLQIYFTFRKWYVRIYSGNSDEKLLYVPSDCLIFSVLLLLGYFAPREPHTPLWLFATGTPSSCLTALLLVWSNLGRKEQTFSKCGCLMLLRFLLHPPPNLL